jgi:hypothetical protein
MCLFAWQERRFVNQTFFEEVADIDIYGIQELLNEDDQPSCGMVDYSRNTLLLG